MTTMSPITSMSLWRLEWLRLVRTRRWVALGGVFVLFGLIGPLMARYEATLLASGGRLHITAPPPVPADGVGGYVHSAMQLGLLVAVVVAAAAFGLDENRSLSIFYRTLMRRPADLLVPRFVVAAAAAAVAWLLGLLAAWYETAALIGAPATRGMLAAAGLGALYVVFAVAVTALAATVARSPSGIVGCALVVLLGLPILGRIHLISAWLPSALADAPDALLRHTGPDHYARAGAVAAVVIVLSVAVALRRIARREP